MAFTVTTGGAKSLIAGAILLVLFTAVITRSFLAAPCGLENQRRPSKEANPPRPTTRPPAPGALLGVVNLAAQERNSFWASTVRDTFPSIAMPATRSEWIEAMRASLFLQGLTPTTSCLQTRYGILGDGGKTLCNVQQFLTNSECLVYSVGVQYTCEVEMQLNRDFPQCTILMFDPTSKEFFKTARCCKVNNMQCIPKALGGGDGVAEKDKVGMAGDTLTELMKQHGHAGRTLNLLKMDIEGSEYNALEYYLNNAQTAKFPDVDLLLMEIHYLNRVRIRELVAKIIEWLEDIGLSIYYVERNPRYPMQLAEIALVNRSRLVLV
eukprot:scpid89007/ scgid21823/ 